MTDTSTLEEMERAAVLQEVLRFISVPKTVEEVADHFNWHPQTAREKLWSLRDMGRARPTARKSSRKKLWQATGGVGTHGEVTIVTSQGTFKLNSLLAVDERRKATGNIIASALSYLWTRAYYGSQDQEIATNTARMGTLDPLLDVRRLMERVYLDMTRQMEALEQMLIEMPELWQNGGAVLNMLGAVNKEPIEERAREFEVWARQLLGQ